MRVNVRRYGLFAGASYDGYAGGWGDFKRYADDERELIDAVLRDATLYSVDWYQIVDFALGKIVSEGDVGDLRRKYCEHNRTHRVEPYRGTILASGQCMTPGLYCSDCGKWLGE